MRFSSLPASFQSPFASHACQKPLTTNSTLGRSTNNHSSLASNNMGLANPKSINNVVRVAPRPKNPSQSVASGVVMQTGNSHSVHQNQFANTSSNSAGSAGGGGAYRTNLFATDYVQQQHQTARGTHNDTRTGMNTMASNAINFAAYQQPNYPQYAHTAPRNRSSGGGGASPRNANVPGAPHKLINDQSAERSNGAGSKSLLPNPFLISRAASAAGAGAGQSKGKLPSSASSASGGGGDVDGTNKKFNSLKSSLAGLRKTPQFYYSMRLGGNNNGTGADKVSHSKGKSCKRHQSFNQPKSGGDGGLSYAEEEQGDYYYEGGEQQHTLYYEEQPLYENLTDSIQIHELSTSSVQQQALTDQMINNEQQKKGPPKPKHQQRPLHKMHQHRHHHHHQHGEKLKKGHHKSCDMIERNSIYRSDSGISNSSYECITPVPAPRTANGEVAVATPAVGYECTGGTTGKKSKKKMPVYMNLAGHLGATREAAAAVTVAGTDSVDGIVRAAAGGAVNSIANTNSAEVCLLHFN